MLAEFNTVKEFIFQTKSREACFCKHFSHFSLFENFNNVYIFIFNQFLSEKNKITRSLNYP